MSFFPPYIPSNLPLNLLTFISLLLLHLPTRPIQTLPLLHYILGYHLPLHTFPLFPLLLSLLLPPSSPLHSSPFLLSLSISSLLPSNPLFSSTLSLLLLFPLPLLPQLPSFPLPILPPPKSLLHAASIFTFRKNIVSVLQNLPFPSDLNFFVCSIQLSLFSSLALQLRSQPRDYPLHLRLRPLLSVLSCALIFTQFPTPPSSYPTPGSLLLSVSTILTLHGICILLARHLRKVMVPCAIIGGNFMLALVIAETKLVDRVLAGVWFGDVSVLDVVTAGCEVLGGGRGEFAIVLYDAFKVFVIGLICLSWEGRLPVHSLNMTKRKGGMGGRRLGGRGGAVW